ncbi:MAG: tRNA (adenosine(37)-N6)-threonylcarbamoyltransferase complex dimerization subunit type 1 TsaB [Flavobacterium sp.]|nr:tRNA (adenosine(37)-N6)-threonylcarbamoyltransferase complex dimerization subunit type 1 TsaB [Flavobacterium sp.]
MALILNIETATKNCSVSLSDKGNIINYREIAEQGYSHAEKLHVFIEEVLLEASVQFSDLKAVAVSQGPGSYTGLRIGVSAAKGLCYALNIPMIALDTLSVLAHQIQVKQGLIIPMIDARRMEVYSAIFDSQYQKIMETQAEIITEESFNAYDETIYFLGDSTTKCKEVLKRSNYIFMEEIVYPSSKDMAKLSYEKYQENDFVDVAYFEPLYLKDFVATTPKSKL